MLAQLARWGLRAAGFAAVTALAHSPNPTLRLAARHGPILASLFGVGLPGGGLVARSLKSGAIYSSAMLSTGDVLRMVDANNLLPGVVDSRIAGVTRYLP